MDSDWKQMIAALGAAAAELAKAASGEARASLMLRALGRELQELAAHPREATPRATARTLLLAAERAAKVAEAAAALHQASDERLLAAATNAMQLAQTLAAGAQARAASLLPQLADQELRDNFAHAFAMHAQQTESIAT